jgi:hypothetical protein
MRIDTSGQIWRVSYFRSVAIGESFRCNGNTWRKQSSRTATGISDGLPSRAMYFGQSDVCERIYKTV